VAWVAGGVILLATVVGFADVVFQVSLARSLNLFVDLYLLGAVYNLAVGNMGLPMTLVAIVGLVVTLGLLTFGLARLLAPADVKRWGLVPRFAGVALIALFALGLTGETMPGVQDRLSLPVARLARTQAGLLRQTLGERKRFQADLAAPDSYAHLPGLLGKLRDRDVLLTFVESYGMAALDDPELAAVVRPRLDTLARRMAESGIRLATGTFVSPTQGGQSWYAHGTVTSGLWLDNQIRYDLLMSSDRETLVDDFRHAGHHTAVLMPAITMAWPDGSRLRFDEVYTSQNIDYAGPPLYWVTMPDQFTWSYLQNTVRPRAGGRAQFVETGLVSSHAPWTPVLPMIDWDAIGDGSAFAPYRQEGHPPEELWIDIEQLRRQYAQSVDYSLQAMAGFAERYLDDRTLLIVLGDHQAAPWVTGTASSAVPVHVLARDPALIEPFIAWGFAPGAIPDRQQPERRMDQFRDWFVHAYSGEPTTTDTTP
jgi:hypothetical protein